MGKMKQYFKITAGLLLLFQVIHLASPQYSTDSPGRTIDGSWLRDLAKNKTASQNTAVPEEEPENDQKTDATTVESNSDYDNGIASGSMLIFDEEEKNVTGRDEDANEETDDLTVATTTIVPSTVLNVTTEHPELPDIQGSPTTTAAMDSTNSSRTNMTEEVFNNSTATPQNSTTDLGPQNSTSLLDYSNHTDSQTTLAPEGSATQESTTKPVEDTKTTKSTNTTTPVPDITETSTASSSTTVFISTSTEISPDTTTTAAQNTPETANKTGKGSATGSSSERGLESDSHNSRRNGAWGAVLGTAAAATFVGLVAYLFLKKKYQRDFSHRKLVEEYPSDPVLRLDNSEPLDLNFGRSAYYNPGLQGDNIQMSHIPGRR